MLEQLVQMLGDKYKLVEKDSGEVTSLKANGMKFYIKAFHAEGLGHVSIMTAGGFFGLMQMDTLMVVPEDRDLPLYSYDRIYAMGNDTLIVELYDTMVEKADLSQLDSINQAFVNLPERDPGVHWYDNIKLPQSISKKGKKKQSYEFDQMALQHFEAYLNAPAKVVTDKAQKEKLSAAYVNGLLEQGGPSTDVFKKALGPEKTEKLFHEVLFGTAR